MKQGDLVFRRSYGGDVLFKIQEISRQQAVLRGVDFRLLADSPVSDLWSAPQSEQIQHQLSVRPELLQSMRRIRPEQTEAPFAKQAGATQGTPAAVPGFFEMPGKVLHLDGDPAYLRKSMQLYGELRVPAEGYYVAESEMSSALLTLLPRVRPDIVVITGHDGIYKSRRADKNSLSSYKNSYNFVNAVRTARQYEKNKDALTIVAGACQSHFEALLHAGANFASSPGRVLIHALDPLCVAVRVAYTSIRDTVNVADVISLTSSGLEGLGGLESKGSYRRGLPHIQHSVTY